MNLSENAEELLEALWTQAEKKDKTRFSLESVEINRENDTLNQLITLNLVSLSENYISLTSKGESEAKNVVRRHRLAERLLVDILDVEDALIEEAACRFEHVIRKGIDENICILLGHPRICPHGNPIPMGKCCTVNDTKATQIVTSLAQMGSNQEGKIAYIHAKDEKRLQKLMAMGVIPGKPIRFMQRFPSYVFQIGQTQIAVDEEIANEIFVIQTKSNK